MSSCVSDPSLARRRVAWGSSMTAAIPPGPENPAKKKNQGQPVVKKKTILAGGPPGMGSLSLGGHFVFFLRHPIKGRKAQMVFFFATVGILFHLFVLVFFSQPMVFFFAKPPGEQSHGDPPARI